jgi:hypothetical protein
VHYIRIVGAQSAEKSVISLLTLTSFALLFRDSSVKPPVFIEGVPVAVKAGIGVVQIDSVKALGQDPVNGGCGISGGFVCILAASADDDVSPVRMPPLDNCLLREFSCR